MSGLLWQGNTTPPKIWMLFTHVFCSQQHNVHRTYGFYTHKIILLSEHWILAIDLSSKARKRWGRCFCFVGHKKLYQCGQGAHWGMALVMILGHLVTWFELFLLRCKYFFLASQLFIVFCSCLFSSVSSHRFCIVNLGIQQLIWHSRSLETLCWGETGAFSPTCFCS